MTGEEKKKKLNLLQLLAVSGASVASMCIGSLLGIRGTYIGTGVGTLISGVLAFIFEKSSLKARDKVRRQTAFLKPDDEDATSMFPAIKVRRSQRPWLLAGAAVLMALVSAGIALGIFGVVKASGTTLGNYTPVAPVSAPAVTVTPTVTSSETDTFTPSASATAPASPTVTPTVTRTITATPSPDASPDAQADSTPSPTGTPTDHAP